MRRHGRWWRVQRRYRRPANLRPTGGRTFDANAERLALVFVDGDNALWLLLQACSRLVLAVKNREGGAAVMRAALQPASHLLAAQKRGRQRRTSTRMSETERCTLRKELVSTTRTSVHAPSPPWDCKNPSFCNGQERRQRKGEARAAKHGREAITRQGAVEAKLRRSNGECNNAATAG